MFLLKQDKMFQKVAGMGTSKSIKSEFLLSWAQRIVELWSTDQKKKASFSHFEDKSIYPHSQRICLLFSWEFFSYAQVFVCIKNSEKLM